MAETFQVEAPRLLKWLQSILRYLRYIAGDPLQAERAIFLSNTTAVTDTALSFFDEQIDVSQVWSTMIVQFSQASGSGRYSIAPRFPSAGGVGLQQPSGGGTLTIRGAENIRNFRVIAETGQAMTYTALLFKAGLWNAEKD